MPWSKDGHIFVNHPREPWGQSDAEIIVHGPLNALKGKKATDERKRYIAAKREFDLEAAFDVVERTVSQAALDTIVAHVIAAGCKARIVMPHPEFDDEDNPGAAGLTNAIPFAFAKYLKDVTGRAIDEEIAQVARVGRTKLTKWQRFLYQPSFGGAIRTDEPYLLIDDAVSTAGTLAALRSYIVRNGGSVVCSTALANALGKNQPFQITLETSNDLIQAYGDGFEPYWRETFGHDVSCLTETEGRFLRTWCDEKENEGVGTGDPLLQRLRAKLDSVAAA